MNKQYCPYCMSELGEDATCPTCGPLQEGYTAPPHHLAPDTVLADRYVVGRSLDEGAAGITYLGLDTHLGSKVAIREYYPVGGAARIAAKSLSVSGINEDFESGKKSFVLLAQAAAKAEKCKEIASVLDVFEANNTAYAVTEYIEGETLKQYVAKNGAMGAADVLSVMKPLMVSLEVMHKAGLFHGDINPGNIIIADGALQLLDFGCVGAKKEDGAAADVYGLCSVMYYALTAAYPPASEDAPLTMRSEDAKRREAQENAMYWDHRPADLKRPWLTKAQEEAIQKGLSSKKEDRFGSVQALMDALYPAAPEPSAPKKEAPKSTKPEWLFPALGLLIVSLVLALIIALVLLQPWKSEDSGGETVSATAQGFGGDVTVTLTLEDGVITAATAEGPDETAEIGGAALEELAAQVVEANGADIDGVSGATYTSNAVREATAAALAQASGGSGSGETVTGTATGFGEGVTVTLTVDNGVITSAVVEGPNETEEIGGAALEELAEQVVAANGSDIDGVSGATLTSNAVREATEAALAQVSGSADASDEAEEAEETEEAEEDEEATAKEAYGTSSGTATYSAIGFGGDVTVTITMEDGYITECVIDGPDETEEVGGAALEELAQQVVDANSAEIDGVSGATFTTEAVQEAAGYAIEDITGSGSSEEEEEAAESGTYYGEALGFGGTVSATLTVEDGVITACELEGPDETETIGGAALEELAEQVVEANGADIDGVSGASYTSDGVREAVEAALSGAAEEETSAGSSETLTGEAVGFGGTITATLTVEDGVITACELEGPDETETIGGAALEELAEQVVEANGADIDGVSGASYTSDGVREAVEAALSGAAEEETSGESSETLTGEAEGFGGTVTATLTVEDGVITACELEGPDETETIGQVALEELAEQVVEANGSDIDGVSGASYTSNAVKEAVAAALGE